MNPIKTFLLLSVGLLETTAHAVEGEFQLAPGLVDKVYESTKAPDTERPPRLEVGAQAGLFLPSALEIESGHFVVPYTSQLDDIGVGTLRFGAEVARSGEFSALAEFAVGFSQIQGVYGAESKSSLDVEDNLTLQWLPLSAAFRGEWTGLSSLRPQILAGPIANWLHQRGTLDGMDVSMWAPGWQAGLALALFGSDDPERGFGGLTLSTTYQTSAADGVVMRGVTHAVGTAISL